MFPPPPNHRQPQSGNLSRERESQSHAGKPNSSKLKTYGTGHAVNNKSKGECGNLGSNIGPNLEIEKQQQQQQQPQQQQQNGENIDSQLHPTVSGVSDNANDAVRQTTDQRHLRGSDTRDDKLNESGLSSIREDVNGGEEAPTDSRVKSPIVVVGKQPNPTDDGVLYAGVADDEVVGVNDDYLNAGVNGEDLNIGVNDHDLTVGVNDEEVVEDSDVIENDDPIVEYDGPSLGSISNRVNSVKMTPPSKLAGSSPPPPKKKPKTKQFRVLVSVKNRSSASLENSSASDQVTVSLTNNKNAVSLTNGKNVASLSNMNDASTASNGKNASFLNSNIKNIDASLHSKNAASFAKSDVISEANAVLARSIAPRAIIPRFFSGEDPLPAYLHRLWMHPTSPEGFLKDLLQRVSGVIQKRNPLCRLILSNSLSKLPRVNDELRMDFHCTHPKCSFAASCFIRHDSGAMRFECSLGTTTTKTEISPTLTITH